MKKIKDERLIIQGLKNIRIAFVVQTLGILAILVYEGISKGTSTVTNNPLWLVFIITAVVLAWLNIKISVDVDETTSEGKKPLPYYWIVIISLLIGTVLGLLTKFGPDKGSYTDSLIIAGVVFVCCLLPFTFVYFIRKKRARDERKL